MPFRLVPVEARADVKAVLASVYRFCLALLLTEIALAERGNDSSCSGVAWIRSIARVYFAGEISGTCDMPKIPRLDRGNVVSLKIWLSMAICS